MPENLEEILFFSHKIANKLFFFPRGSIEDKNLRESRRRKNSPCGKKTSSRKKIDSQVTFRNGTLDRNDLTNIYEWLWITRIANRNARHAHPSIHHISFFVTFHDAIVRPSFVSFHLYLHQLSAVRTSEAATFERPA